LRAHPAPGRAAADFLAEEIGKRVFVEQLDCTDVPVMSVAPRRDRPR
jgi:hypothetical protein